MNDDVLTGPGNATLSVASILADAAWRRPDKTALIWAGQTGPDARVTYGDLWEQTKAVAGVLRDRGIGEGDRVAMMVPNVPDVRPRLLRGARPRRGRRADPPPLQEGGDRARAEGQRREARGDRGPVARRGAARRGRPRRSTRVSVLLPEATRDLVPIPRLEDLVAAASRRRSRGTWRTNPLAPATHPLHERHDRRAEGRGRQPPLDRRERERVADRLVRHEGTTTSSSAACPSSTPSARPAC